MINRQNIGPWRVTKNIPGLQTLLETLGVISDSGAKAPATQWIPAVQLTLQLNADGTLTTVVNNVGLTPAVGAGFLVGVSIGSPAAGSDWSSTLSSLNTQAGLSMARARIRGVSALFATSAAVASRTVSLVLRGAGDTISPSPTLISEWPSAVAELASNGGRQILWTPSGPDAAEATGTFPNHIIPFSTEVWLTSRVGWSIGTRTRLIDAGDQWSQINLLLEGYST